MIAIGQNTVSPGLLKPLPGGLASPGGSLADAARVLDDYRPSLADLAAAPAAEGAGVASTVKERTRALITGVVAFTAVGAAIGAGVVAFAPVSTMVAAGVGGLYGFYATMSGMEDSGDTPGGLFVGLIGTYAGGALGHWLASSTISIAAAGFIGGGVAAGAVVGGLAHLAVGTAVAALCALAAPCRPPEDGGNY